MGKEIEIEICNYRPLHSIRCIVCHKFIKHLPHSKKHYVEKRQKTCRSKECLRRYPEVHRNLNSVKARKNKQQRERYKNNPEVRKRISLYNKSLIVKEKRKEYYQRNKEEIIGKVLRYYNENKEEINKKKREERNGKYKD
jgi:hypothetical protein